MIAWKRCKYLPRRWRQIISRRLSLLDGALGPQPFLQLFLNPVWQWLDQDGNESL